MKLQIPRGTHDILPGQSEKWQYIEQIARNLCEIYQYQEIRTPMFENTELFIRGVGDFTDIVQKEMYTFSDKSSRSLTLRPEGTAPVVRSYIENKMHGALTQPVKLYYLAPIFRYERPGEGRYRQHHQFGVEALGSENSAIDAEIISLALHFFEKLGLTNLKVAINSLGDDASRTTYRTALIAHFEKNIAEFCTDCQRRINENPLRILDCKKDHDHKLLKTAPKILDYLNKKSQNYFATVQNHLAQMNIKTEIDPTLVRGLDYYNHTVFEIMLDNSDFLGKRTLCGGGRYTNLVEQLGGQKTAGIGFGLGIERLLLALTEEKITLPIKRKLDCYLVTIGEAANLLASNTIQKLRKAGISAEKDYLDRKIKAQFKAADRLGARFVAILGDDEVVTQEITVKNMETSEQIKLPLSELVSFLEGK